MCSITNASAARVCVDDVSISAPCEVADDTKSVTELLMLATSISRAPAACCMDITFVPNKTNTILLVAANPVSADASCAIVLMDHYSSSNRNGDRAHARYRLRKGKVDFLL